MIQQYILNPYFENIIPNQAFRELLILIIMIMLGYSFILALSKGVVYIWQKLFIHSW